MLDTALVAEVVSLGGGGRDSGAKEPGWCWTGFQVDRSCPSGRTLLHAFAQLNRRCPQFNIWGLISRGSLYSVACREHIRISSTWDELLAIWTNMDAYNCNFVMQKNGFDQPPAEHEGECYMH